MVCCRYNRGIMPDSNDQSDMSPGFLAFGTRLFASRWIALAAITIAMLLTFRAVHNGLEFDDYYHRAVLSGSVRFGEHLGGSQAMFRFFLGGPEQKRYWMDVGVLP